MERVKKHPIGIDNYLHLIGKDIRGILFPFTIQILARKVLTEIPSKF